MSKNKQKYLLAGILIMLIAFTANGKKSEVAEQQFNPLAMLKKSSKFYEKFKKYQIQWECTETNIKENKTKTKKGKISIKKDQYQLDFKDQQIFCDGKKIWQYYPAIHEVVVQLASKEMQGWKPDKLYLYIKKQYDLMFISKPGDQYNCIELIKKNSYLNQEASIKIFLNKKDYQLKQIVMEERDTITSYEVLGFNAEIDLPDELFQFDISKYGENLILIDLAEEA